MDLRKSVCINKNNVYSKCNKYGYIICYTEGKESSNEDDKFIIDVEDLDIIRKYVWHKDKLHGGFATYLNKKQYSLLQCFADAYNVEKVARIDKTKLDFRKSNLFFGNEYIKADGYYAVSARVIGKNIVDYFFIDEDDYDLVSRYNWSINKSGYVRGYLKGQHENNTIALHRLIMGIIDEDYKHVIVDHIFHNPLDNRKSQLRVVTHEQNQKNRIVRKDSSSGILGIKKGYISKKKGQSYTSYIAINGKYKHLGTFYNIEDAIKSRKLAEKKYYGEYACQI